MPTLAVKIFDPAGQEWAQLLDAEERIRRLVPVIVERLELPPDLNYELLERSQDRILHPEDTLPEAGIRGGEELLLRPVKDPILAAFLDALYDEAIGFAAGKTFEAALNRLQTISRLDPDYPDRNGLWREVAQNGGAASASPWPSGGSKGGRSQPRSGSRGGSSGSAGASALSSSGRAGGASGTATASGGCLIKIFVVVLIGCAGVYFSGGCEEIGWPPEIIVNGGDGEVEDSVEVGGVIVGSGDVRVTLQWDNQADVDLHVTDPSDTEIYFRNLTSPTGGQLDVDANAGCDGDPQVENVFWPRGSAPRGRFAVDVNYFNSCQTTGPAQYTVTAFVDGREVQRQSGTIGPGQRIQAFQFTR